MILKYNDRIIPPGYRFTISPFHLDLPEGKITLLEGDNGSGKTTFMRLLAGVLHPGLKLQDFLSDHQNKIRGKGLFQPISFDPQLSLKKNLKLWCQPYGNYMDHEYFYSILIEMDLKAYLGTKWGKCSSGTRQKFALAATLSQDVQLYFLDEPLVHLDQSSAETVIKHLKQKTGQKATILITSHLQRIWSYSFQKRYCIDEGEITLKK